MRHTFVLHLCPCFIGLADVSVDISYLHCFDVSTLILRFSDIVFWVASDTYIGTFVRAVQILRVSQCSMCSLHHDQYG